MPERMSEYMLERMPNRMSMECQSACQRHCKIKCQTYMYVYIYIHTYIYMCNNYIYMHFQLMYVCSYVRMICQGGDHLKYFFSVFSTCTHIIYNLGCCNYFDRCFLGFVFLGIQKNRKQKHI